MYSSCQFEHNLPTTALFRFDSLNTYMGGPEYVHRIDLLNIRLEAVVFAR